MMRRGKGGENEVVSNPQRSPRKIKVLKSCHWAARRRRRKASDEDGRSHVSLSIRLAKLGREKRTLSGELNMYAESQRRDAQSDGRRDDAMARKKAQRKNPKAAATRRRRRTTTPRSTMEGGAERGGFVEEKHDTDGREQGDSPPRPPQGRDRRKGGAKNHNRPECSTRFEEEAEKVRHDTLSTRCRGSCRERRRTEKHSQAASYVELSILFSRI